MPRSRELAKLLDTGLDPAAPRPDLERLLDEAFDDAREDVLHLRQQLTAHRQAGAHPGGAQENASLPAAVVGRSSAPTDPSTVADLLTHLRRAMAAGGIDVDAFHGERGLPAAPEESPSAESSFGHFVQGLTTEGKKAAGEDTGRRVRSRRTEPPAQRRQAPAVEQVRADPEKVAATRISSAAPPTNPVVRVVEASDKLAQAAFFDLAGYRAALQAELGVRTVLDQLLLDRALLNLSRANHVEALQVTLMRSDPVKHLDQVERFERLSRRAEAAFLRTLDVLQQRLRPRPEISISTGSIHLDPPATTKARVALAGGAAAVPRNQPAHD